MIHVELHDDITGEFIDSCEVEDPTDFSPVADLLETYTDGLDVINVRVTVNGSAQ